MISRWRDWDASRKLIFVSVVGIAVLLVWAAFAQIDMVTRGNGRVIPSSKAQLVQSADPAVVSDILVRSGQTVEAGELLVRLDDSEAASAVGQLRTENERLAARAGRLGAEAGGGGLDCSAGTVCAEERQLAATRISAARSRQSALAAQIEQRRRDLSEGQATVGALESSLKLARDEVNMLAPLAEQGIVPRTELLSAQREVVDIQGRLSAARQGLGRARAAISEAQAELSSARQEFRQSALEERSEVRTRMAVNNESIRGAEARQQRNELRAPVAGIVNDVQVTTVGGFVGPGDTLMQIIPRGEKLIVEARIDPSKIAFIKVGDPANVKISAYDFATYGGLPGRVLEVSADSIYDEVERKAFYVVLVETDRAYFERGGRQYPIVPGMMGDVEIITGRRSILSYIFNPVVTAMDRALTEN